MDVKSIAVKFATGPSLDQSKSYFAGVTYEGELPLVKSSSNSRPSPDEKWEEVAQFDASREVRNSRWRKSSKVAVIEPTLVGWKPDG